MSFHLDACTQPFFTTDQVSFMTFSKDTNNIHVLFENTARAKYAAKPNGMSEIFYSA